MIEWAKVIEYGSYAVLGIGGWFMGRGKRKSDAAVDAAQANAEVAMADAEGTLYRRLREDLDAMRADLNRLRAELDTERKHGRKLERHIWRLERLMREKGLEPPPFVDDEPERVGGTD